MLKKTDIRIAVVGLGYVGLPLAVAFSKRFEVVGFDVNAARITQLRMGTDLTREVTDQELGQSARLSYTDQLEDLRSCNFFIISVPTPIDEHKQPDMQALIEASRMVSRVLKKGDVVVYESTVYPGATEEVCVPVLAESSGLSLNEDFVVGYSPERINPGDKVHRLENITKVTSGSTPAAADLVDWVYAQIIEAGTFKASSIKVAEAAKVIENTQRDLNVALVNELAIIFNRMGIDTQEVLEAAGTKWNFLKFWPGLVGGHCIGVDPYYLTHKAQSLGYHPEIILAGRRLNDSMGVYVTSQLIKAMIKRRIHVDGARVLVMGLAFKENCPDIRNSRVVDIVRDLQQYNIEVDVYDPWVEPKEALREYDIHLTAQPIKGHYDAIILAVAHDQFRNIGSAQIRSFSKSNSVLFDLKYVFDRDESDIRL